MTRRLGIALLVVGAAWLVRLYAIGMYCSVRETTVDWASEVYRIRPALDSLVLALIAVVAGFILAAPWRDHATKD